jgi:leader peptidase (prepilin peptidase)/N-methyltransferase
MVLSFFAFLLGCAVGSFLNVCICRLPLEESLLFPASHCTRCQKPIRFYDNIPLISYVLLRGKCRFCGNLISPQYPLVELLTGALSVLLFLHYSLAEYFIYFVFFCSLLVVTFIDLKYQLIPDLISLPGIGVGFLASFFLPRITYLDSLLGIALGGGSLYLVAYVYYKITKVDGMGGGDVKLLAMIGAFLGGKAVVVTIFISALIGSLVGITVMIVKNKDRKHAIPYGPFLSTGAMISLFWGDALLSWYHHFLYGR